MSKSPISRRHFIAGVGLLAGTAALPSHAAAPVSSGQRKAVPPRRRLGKTDLEITTVSLGTVGGQGVNLIKYAMQQGINYIHTSTSYQGGKSIANVAKAIRGQRNQVTLGIKITWKPGDLAAMQSALDTLGTDYVDIGFFNIHNANQVSDPTYRAAATALKKAGKVRYIGLTSHGDVLNCMNAALDQGYYDVLMPKYSLGAQEQFMPMFERAEKAGVGITLMKTNHGLHGDDYRKSIARYLETPAVTTVTKTMGAFVNIDQMIEDANRPLTAQDRRQLQTAAQLAAVGHCSACGTCADVCPRGVAVADLVRCSEYYLEDTVLVPAAHETYAAARGQGGECTGCGACERACPHGVPVRHHMRRAERILA